MGKTSTPLLCDRLWPAGRGSVGVVARDVTLIVLGTALTALFAQIALPWKPQSFTLQTLAVCLCGIALGVRRATLSQLLYLAAAWFGASVLPNGDWGVTSLAGSQAGYLVALPIVAAIMGYFAERDMLRNLWFLTGVTLALNLLALALGALWLGTVFGSDGWRLGFAPFIHGAIFQTLVVSAIYPEVQRHLLDPVTRVHPEIGA